ncbi:MAG: uracil-DNA glycosylase [Pseudomonadota bacterium]
MSNCSDCRHFFITWEQDTPRGCRAYKFKSKQLPSIVVREQIGEECLAFDSKKKKKLKEGEVDLNDPDLWGDQE